MPNGGNKKAVSSIDKEIKNAFEIGGLKVVFKTMPQDLVALGIAKKTQAAPAASGSLFATQHKDIGKTLKLGETQDQITTKKELVKSLYQEAKSLYNRRFYDEAAAKFADILQINPKHRRARWFLKRAQTNAVKHPRHALWAQRKAKETAVQELQKQVTAEMRPAQPQPVRPQTETLPAEPSEKIPQFKPLPEGTEQLEKVDKALLKVRQEAEKKARAELGKRLVAEEKIRQQLLEKARAEEEAKKQLSQRIELEEARQRVLEQELLTARQRASQYATKTDVVSAEIDAKPYKAPPAPPKALPMTPEAPPATEPVLRPPLALSPYLKTLASPQILKIVGVVLLVAVFAGGAIYWIGWQKTASPTEVAPPPSEAILPQPLFSVNDTSIITLRVGQKKLLFSELEHLSETRIEPGTFTRILVKFVSDSGQQNYSSLTDLIDAIRLAFPPEISSALEDSYTLFLYSQKETYASPFAMGLGQNKLGLVIRIQNKENMAQKFFSWEKNMDQDLDTLFLGKKIVFEAQPQFEEVPYRDAVIRALFLPNRFSCLNYTFYDNKVIITSSLEATEALIDRMNPGK